MSDIEKIKKLRQSTGAGFKDCNAAIQESAGDLDKAVEILRVKGIAKASKSDGDDGIQTLSFHGIEAHLDRLSIIDPEAEGIHVDLSLIHI